MEVTVSVVVGADRRLVIDLPPMTPLGPADVTIRPSAASETSRHLTRDATRAALHAAGLLAAPIPALEGAIPLTEEVIARMGTLPAGAPLPMMLVAEDRGAR
ncbi:MAG: hypothetical protein ACRDIE_18275 [Chloroflexota bacterium]